MQFRCMLLPKSNDNELTVTIVSTGYSRKIEMVLSAIINYYDSCLNLETYYTILRNEILINKSFLL